MNLRTDILKLINRIRILYKGEEIECNQFLNAYIEFITSSFNTDYQRCLVLHPGTEIFTILGLILNALSNLYEDSIDKIDIIHSINKGDKVILSEKTEQLAIFQGMEFLDISKKEMAVFELKDGGRKYLPPSSYYKITPYYGNAQTLGSRGIGTNLSIKKRFYSFLLNDEEKNINPLLTSSIVIVCDKILADSIMNDLQISYMNEKPIRMCEIFAGAYYTQNDVTYYAGNSYRFEPVLKFTPRISIARELIIEDCENNITSLCVCGGMYFRKSITELTDLLERKSLAHVFLLSEITEMVGTDLLGRYPDMKLFASTPQALNCFEVVDIATSNGLNAKLNQSIKALVNNNIDYINCQSPIEKGNYEKLKQNLFVLSRAEDRELGEFVIAAYSLLKIITFSIFPLSHLDKISNKQAFENYGPSTKMNYINEYSNNYKGINENEVKQTREDLSNLFLNTYYENSKFQYIFDSITTYFFEKKLLLVVPKVYFKDAFYYSFKGKNSRYIKNVDVVTPNNLRKKDITNCIVILCGIFGKEESIFLDNLKAYDLKVLLYSFEEPLLAHISRAIENSYTYYNSRNHLFCINSKEVRMGFDECNNGIEEELDLFVQKLELSTITAFASQLKSGTQNGMSEVFKIINFITGETAFLTRYFEVYVLNHDNGQIEEKSVSELVEGDELVFAKRDEQSKDMIDVLLKRIIFDKQCPEQLRIAYQLSKHWKTVLKTYISDQKITYRQLAERMREFGKGKHEATLRTWLNEDAHIVGPRDEESFYEIALLTEDDKMLESPEIFRDACDEIRSLRIRILKYIGKYVFGKHGRQGKHLDVLLNNIIGDISDTIQIYQVAQILDGKDATGSVMSVPSYFTNRPQLKS